MQIFRWLEKFCKVREDGILKEALICIVVHSSESNGTSIESSKIKKQITYVGIKVIFHLK